MAALKPNYRDSDTLPRDFLIDRDFEQSRETREDNAQHLVMTPVKPDGA